MAHLVGAAGKIVGVGDWRGQKGGPYGAFKVVGDNDAAFKRIVKEQGREAQLRALETPQFFDEDTRELLTWFEEEVGRREMTEQLINPNGKGKRVHIVSTNVHGSETYQGAEPA
jgi:hypothetical protein